MQDTRATLLFGIGAQKAGTTWLHDWLASMPAVHVPPVKEVHYFDVLLNPAERPLIARRARDAAAAAEALAGADDLPAAQAGLERLVALLGLHARGDDAEYLRYLRDGAGQASVIADITPSYATLDRAGFARMAAVAPRTKFLFILRDPVDRLWSSLRMTAARVAADEAGFVAETARRFDAALAGRAPRQMERSDYARTLTELWAAVPAGDVLCVFYEDLFTAPVLARITRFLGLPDAPAPVGQAANAGRALGIDPARLRAGVAALAPSYRFVADRFGADLPSRWRERMALCPDRVAA